MFFYAVFCKKWVLRWCAAMLRLKKSGQVCAKWTTVSECISLMWEERVADCLSGSIWTVFIQWEVHSSGTSETSDINFLQDKGYHSNRSHWPQANGADTCPPRHFSEAWQHTPRPHIQTTATHRVLLSDTRTAYTRSFWEKRDSSCHIEILNWCDVVKKTVCLILLKSRSYSKIIFSILC